MNKIVLISIVTITALTIVFRIMIVVPAADNQDHGLIFRTNC